MRTRWIAALAVALVLATLTLTVPSRWGGAEACASDAPRVDFSLTFKDLRRQEVRLSDYRGKVLLLDFWATWCGPCRLEIPAFVTLVEKYRSQGFEAVGVVVQDDFALAAPFAEKFKMNYAVVDGNERDDVEAAFGPFVGLPTSLLIDREGRVCRRHLGLPPGVSSEADMERAIQEAFEAEIKALL